jgi:hypothetical protein
MSRLRHAARATVTVNLVVWRRDMKGDAKKERIEAK